MLCKPYWSFYEIFIFLTSKIKQNKFTMKALLRLPIIISICVSCFSPVEAQDDFSRQKDSILSVIPTLTSEEKLDAYDKLGEQLYFYEGDTAKIMPVFRAWEKEAATQGDIMLQRRIIYFSLGILVNRRYYEQFLQETERFFTFAEQHGLYDEHYYMVHKSRLIRLYELGRFNESLSETRLLYDISKENNRTAGQITALFCMAEIYFNLRKFSETEKCYLECLDLFGIQLSEQDTRTVISCYFGLTDLYVIQKQHEKAFEVLEKWEALLDKDDNENKAHNGYNRRQYYFMKAFVYTQTEDTPNAVSCLHKADAIRENFNGIENPEFRNRVRALVLELQGRYNEAIELMNEITTGDNSMISASLMSEKARMMCKAGRGNEAYPLFFGAQEIRDSIQSMNFNMELNDLRTRYKIDTHIAEKEKKQQQVLLAVTVCLLLSIVLLVYMLYSRRLKQRNLTLYKQVQELMRIEKAAQKYLINTPEDNLSDAMRLFRRLSKCMETQKLFADPDLSRKKLADLLKSNEIYIAAAIKESTGETYSSYISNTRLQHAIKLLNNDPPLTLDAVAIDSGHGSYSSFYRLFIKKYGITPSEYRKLSIERGEEE